MKWTTDANFLGWRDQEGGDGSGSGGDAGGSQVGSQGGSQGGSSSTLLDGDAGQGDDQGDGSGGQDSGGDAGVAQSWFKGFINEDGSLNKDRLDHLPAELQPFKDRLERYNSADSLLRGFMNSSDLNGKKALEPLSPNASEEAKKERAKLMASLNGTPNEPAGYGFKKPDNWPEDMPWSDERTGKYAEILHRHQASPELAQELLQAQLEDAQAGVGDIQAQIDQQIADGKKALQTMVGDDKLGETVNAAKRALLTLNWDGFDKHSNAVKDPFVVRLLAEHAKLLGEDNLVGGNDRSTSGLNARSAALDIVNNKDNKWHAAYHDPEHRDHEAAIEEKQRLDRLARQQTSSQG